MSKALRLYQITDTAASGKDRAVPGLDFSRKEAAKAKRRELNGTEADPQKIRYVVSPGPDHRNYHAGQ
jgi:hypothetical protein